MTPLRPDRRRPWSGASVAGGVLLALGLSGLALFGSLTVALTRPIQTDDVRATVVRLDGILADAALTATSAESALASTGASASRLAEMLQALSTSLRSGAAALQVELLGTRPFVDVASQFSATADRAADAAAEVQATRLGIDATRTALATSSDDLSALRAELAVLIEAADTVAAWTGPLGLVTLWFAALSVAIAGHGVSLVLRDRRPVKPATGRSVDPADAVRAADRGR